MADSNLIRLSGLWAHTQEDGSTVLTGNLGGGARVVILPVRDKASAKAPDYALYIAPGDKKDGQQRKKSRPMLGH